MPSRLLLINFSKKEAEKLATLKIDIDRGYVSDVEGYADSEFSKNAEIVRFYLPHPPYEYNIIVANLSHNEDVVKEFHSKAKNISHNDIFEFYKFWMTNGILIIFLGDYKYRDLLNLGMGKVGLEKVTTNDITCKYMLSEDASFKKFFKEIQKEVTMPTNHYLSLDEKAFAPEKSFKTIYRNPGNYILATYLNNRPGYDSADNPEVIILPQFKNNVGVLEKLLKEITKIFTKLIPELYSPDWIESDKYYPLEVTSYDDDISNAIKEAQEKISVLQINKQDAKNKYSFLREVLSGSGEELKINVMKVLTEIFKVEVKDADKEKAGDLAEDVLIKINDIIILAEIKGVSDKNPSPRFITQVWKHIHHSKHKDVAKGALILNYDIKTDPAGRHLAYQGEYEKELEDIIFIDTRVLFELAIAILDYGLPVEDAKKILCNSGRASFELTSYNAGKKSTSESKDK